MNIKSIGYDKFIELSGFNVSEKEILNEENYILSFEHRSGHTVNFNRINECVCTKYECFQLDNYSLIIFCSSHWDNYDGTTDFIIKLIIFNNKKQIYNNMIAYSQINDEIMYYITFKLNILKIHTFSKKCTIYPIKINGYHNALSYNIPDINIINYSTNKKKISYHGDIIINLNPLFEKLQIDIYKTYFKTVSSFYCDMCLYF